MKKLCLYGSRFHQFSGKIFVAVLRFRFQTPAVDERAELHAVAVGRIDTLVAVEVAYAVVLETHGHRVFWQHEERAVHDERIGLVQWRKAEREAALDFDVARKTFGRHEDDQIMAF